MVFLQCLGDNELLNDLSTKIEAGLTFDNEELPQIITALEVYDLPPLESLTPELGENRYKHFSNNFEDGTSEEVNKKTFYQRHVLGRTLESQTVDEALRPKSSIEKIHLALQTQKTGRGSYEI